MTLHLRVTNVGALIAVLAGAVPASAVPPGFSVQAEALLKSSYPDDGPGASVIVVEHGRTVFASGRGLANMATGEKITPRTVFRMASISKQFVAAVILQLSQQGRLSLTDPLSKYIPGYPSPGADATIEHLMNHRSGIANFTDIPGWMDETTSARAFTTDELVAQFKNKPNDFAPGAQFKYNNSGYVLLAAIIERVTGKPWHVAVTERISEPLRLTTIRNGEEEAKTRHMAFGYTFKDGKPLPAQRMHMTTANGAGALIGSVEDFARWTRALHSGKVLQPDGYARMITPLPLPSAKADYGFGLRRQNIRGREVIGHTGDVFGFLTAGVYLPNEHIFVAVFANADNPEIDPKTVLQRLTALAVGDPIPVFATTPVDHSALQPYFGIYRLGNAKHRFYQRGDKLFTRAEGGSDEEVLASRDNVFFGGPNKLTWFKLVRDEVGRPAIDFYKSSASKAERASWISAAPADAPAVRVPRAILETYVGNYRNGEMLMKVVLDKDNQLSVQIMPKRPRTLIARSNREFAVEGIDGEVTFHTEGSAVRYITVSHGGQEVRVERVKDGF